MRLRSGQKTGEGDENPIEQAPEKEKPKTNPARGRRGLLTLLTLVKYILIAILCMYLSFPLVLHTFPIVPRELMFLSRVRWPYYVDFDHPENYNLSGGRNVLVKSTDDATLGVWQILPKRLAENGKEKTTEYYEKALSDGKPVIMYFHGNSGNRARDHRIELYNILAGLNYHVVAFDYRGYGDSTGRADGAGVMQDAEVMYEWLKPKIGVSKLFLYGHSLGTAVATSLSRKICEKGSCPNGLILESPFTDVREEASNHPLARFWKFWPAFDTLFLGAFGEFEHYNSTKNIEQVKCKILIMHAQDDLIVPFKLGEKLAKHAGSNRAKEDGELKFFAFRGDRGFGHKHLCRAEELPSIVKKFIETSREHDVVSRT
ncbi:lysophosphatidylserine lipase ABHD12-like [Glandiceps talaboti]